MTIAQAQQPLVFIVSGPSGSGKSTLVEKMLEVPGTMFSISCTTRPPRATESPGKWYDFISEAEFERRVSQGEFLEYARVFGKHWYGTPRRWLEEAQRKGLDLVLEIDVQGAEQVKQKLPDAVAIFILPPAGRNSNGGCARAARIPRKRSSAGSSGPGRKCSATRSTIFWWSMTMSSAPDAKCRRSPWPRVVFAAA